MRRIKSFSELPDIAKEKILEQINNWIKECEESYEIMSRHPNDIDGIVYDVKKEFSHECERYSVKIYEICDDYNFEWEIFKKTQCNNINRNHAYSNRRYRAS